MQCAEAEMARAYALSMLRAAGILLTEAEEGRIETADFGLNEFARTGLALLTYVNTDRCCAKELVLLPGQTCPEHLHPSTPAAPGKEETFRCRRGEVYLYVPGERTISPGIAPPGGVYTVFHEIKLGPGRQYTLAPDTLHWFQAGPEGAVVSEFSTASHDETDVFTDARIIRMPEVD